MAYLLHPVAPLAEAADAWNVSEHMWFSCTVVKV